MLYVGKALRLSDRLRSYLNGSDGRPMIPDLVAEARDLDVILTDSEVEALLLESTLIRQHRPHFNILLKDDKSFPYVRVSVQEEFPRVSVTRHVRADGARYFGPFTDVRVLRRTLRELRRIFPLRTCRNFEDYRRTGRASTSIRCAVVHDAFRVTPASTGHSPTACCSSFGRRPRWWTVSAAR